MRTLLQAVKTRLESQITTVKAANIFYAEHFDVLPPFVTFPAIGIRDGGFSNDLDSVDSYGRNEEVLVCAYVQILKEKEGVVGDSGILALSESIETALMNQGLSISGMMLAFVKSGRPSQLLVSDRDMILKKEMTVIYEQHKNL